MRAPARSDLRVLAHGSLVFAAFAGVVPVFLQEYAGDLGTQPVTDYPK
jgi:hypothetical protein